MSSPGSFISMIETGSSSVWATIDLNCELSLCFGLAVSASDSYTVMLSNDSITEVHAGDDNARSLEERSITYERVNNEVLLVAETFIASKKKDLKIIGSGGFGIVYEVKSGHKGKSFAVKVLKENVAQSSKHTARFINEIQSMKEMDHQNVIKCFHSFAFQHTTAMIMPMASMSLSLFMYNRRPFSDVSLQELVIQLGRGVNYIHSLGWVHRDLKPANILRVNCMWKIADMGFIIHRDKCLLERCTGTSSYWAPELFMGGVHSNASDDWALGLIFANAILKPLSRIYYYSPEDEIRKKVVTKYDYFIFERALYNAKIVKDSHRRTRFKRSFAGHVNKYCGGFHKMLGQDGHPIPSIVRKLPNLRECLLVQLLSLLKKTPMGRMPIGYFLALVQREYL